MSDARHWQSVLSWTLAVLPFLAVILASFVTEQSVVPSPLPQAQFEALTGWADESSCLDCHEQARTFWETGHAQTLHRADDDTVRGLLETLGRSPQLRDEGTSISQVDGQFRVVNRRGRFQSTALLTWCFGSGNHARTWVASLPDSYGMTDLLEFRWSWYHEIDGFDVTPGQAVDPVPGYYSQLGGLFDHAKSRRCFGCHASVLPIAAGAIDETHLHAGVTCQRCHGPRQDHVASAGKTGDRFWVKATREESVSRCAECHRRSDEQETETIRADNPEIARFQPVGLSQSACFQRSKMTCITCHDPHRPMAAQDSGGIWQCTQCHDGAHAQRPVCRAQHRDDCLHCHMPQVATQRPLHFTDHWIRIRESDLHP